MTFLFTFISGLSFGLEFPPPFDDEVAWNFNIDLGIIRIIIFKQK